MPYIMIRRFTFAALAVLLWCGTVAEASADGRQMRDVFASMPDTIEPMVTLNNRLDCIDFIENDMEARVRNVADDYVRLEALTADYARFRTSSFAFMELKLMKSHRGEVASADSTSVASADSTSVASADSTSIASADTILCMVRTVEAGIDSLRIADSRVAFFTPQWQRLPVERFFRWPGVEEFVGKQQAELTAEENRVVEAMRYFCPMKVELSADDDTLTVIPQLGDLEPELRDVGRKLIGRKQIRASW